MVYDALRATAVLNFNHGRTGDWPHGGKNMVTTSTDDGATWSARTPLPPNLDYMKVPESGPGLGLQLSANSRHKGRLLFSGWRDQRYVARSQERRHLAR